MGRPTIGTRPTASASITRFCAGCKSPHGRNCPKVQVRMSDTVISLYQGWGSAAEAGPGAGSPLPETRSVLGQPWRCGGDSRTVGTRGRVGYTGGRGGMPPSHTQPWGFPKERPGPGHIARPRCSCSLHSRTNGPGAGAGGDAATPDERPRFSPYPETVAHDRGPGGE